MSAQLTGVVGETIPPATELLPSMRFDSPENIASIIKTKKIRINDFEGDRSQAMKEGDDRLVKISAGKGYVRPKDIWFMCDVEAFDNNVAGTHTDINAEMRGRIAKAFERVEITNLNDSEICEQKAVGQLEEFLDDVASSRAHRETFGQLSGHYFNYFKDDLPPWADGELKDNAGAQLVADGTNIRNTDLLTTFESQKIAAEVPLVGTAFEAKTIATYGGPDSPYLTAYGDRVRSMNTANGEKFIFRFRSVGFLQSDKFLPLKEMGGLKIKLYRYAKDEWVSSSPHLADAKDPGFHLKNLQVVYPVYELGDVAERAMVNTYQTNKVQVAFDSYKVYSSVDTTNSRYEQVISDHLNNVRSVVVQRWDADRFGSNDITYQSETIGSSNCAKDFVEFQLEHDGISLPNKPIESVQHLYLEFVRSLGRLNDPEFDAMSYEKYKDVTTQAKESQVVNKSWIVYDLERYIDPASVDLTGISITDGNSLKIMYERSTTTNMRLYYFLEHGNLMTLYNDGTIQVTK